MIMKQTASVLTAALRDEKVTLTVQWTHPETHQINRNMFPGGSQHHQRGPSRQLSLISSNRLLTDPHGAFGF